MPPFLKVSGKPYDMGYAHGNAFRDGINVILESSLRNFISASDTETALQKASSLGEIVRKQTPDLYKEVAGIADGAGISIPEALFLQMRFEIKHISTIEPECTSIGVAGSHSSDGYPFIGQNIDLLADNQKHLLVLHLQPKGKPEMLTVTFMGLLVQEGINSEGLGICGNMVMPTDTGYGFPNRVFLRRSFLEQTSIDGVLEILEKFPKRATGHNLLLCDKHNQVINLEMTATRHQVCTAKNGLIVHTNHYLHENNKSFEALDTYEPTAYKDSVLRIERLRNLLETIDNPIPPDLMKKCLSDHGEGGVGAICKHGDKDCDCMKTIASIVCKPHEGEIEFANGNPCEVEYISYFL